MLLIDGWIFWIMVGSIVLGVMIFIALALLLKGVALPFLKAKLLGEPIPLTQRGNGKFAFKVGKLRNSSIETKTGLYMLTSTIAGPGGVRMALVDERFGITLDAELLKNILMVDGYVNDITEADAVIKAYYGEEKIDAEQPDESQPKEGVVGKIQKAYSRQTEKTSNRLQEIVKHIKATPNILDAFVGIDRYYKYNANPTFFKAAIANAVADVLEEQNKTDWMKYIMYIAILMLVGSIAFVIINSQLGGPAAAPETVGAGAKAVASKVVGTQIG